MLRLPPVLLFVNVDHEMRRKSIIYKKYEESALARDIRSCGLRQVLGLPPYVTMPEEVLATEQSSKPCKQPNRPSWRPPTQNEQFQKHMRECLEVILCVRLSNEELEALFTALYGNGSDNAPPTNNSDNDEHRQHDSNSRHTTSSSNDFHT